MPRRTAEQALRDDLETALARLDRARDYVERTALAAKEADSRHTDAIDAYGEVKKQAALIHDALQALLGHGKPDPGDASNEQEEERDVEPAPGDGAREEVLDAGKDATT